MLVRLYSIYFPSHTSFFICLSCTFTSLVQTLIILCFNKGPEGIRTNTYMVQRGLCEPSTNTPYFYYMEQPRPLPLRWRRRWGGGGRGGRGTWEAAQTLDVSVPNISSYSGQQKLESFSTEATAALATHKTSHSSNAMELSTVSPADTEREIPGITIDYATTGASLSNEDLQDANQRLLRVRNIRSSITCRHHDHKLWCSEAHPKSKNVADQLSEFSAVRGQSKRTLGYLYRELIVPRVQF